MQLNIWRRLFPAAAVLVAACSSTPTIQSVSATPAQVVPGGTVTVNVNASEANNPLSYTWTPPTGWTVVGGKTNLPALALTAPATFGASAVVGITVSDPSGNKVSSQIAVSTTTDQSPVINSLKLSGDAVAPGGTVSVVADATSPTGLSLTYTWTSSDQRWTISSLASGIAAITAPVAFSASTILTLVVTDSAGLTVSDSTIIATTSDQAPVVSSLTASASVVPPGQTVTLTAVATSPTGSALAYTWASSNPLWSIAGSAGSATVTAPSLFSSSTVISVTATDSAGLTATDSVEVATSANAAPIISSLTASQNPIQPGGSVTLVVAATSPTGSTITYTWSSSDPTWNLSGNNDTATLYAPNTLAATTVVTVVATDLTGLQASDSIAVSTVGDQAPVVSALSASPNPAQPGTTVTIAAGASSPSGSTLSYNWVSSNPAWVVSGSGSTATVLAPAAYASITVISVAVTDTSGLKATDTVVVSTASAPQPQISAITWTPNNPQASQLVTLGAVTNVGSTVGVTYVWTLTSKPAGSAAALSSTNIAAPTFTPDVSGNYAISLTVSDAGATSTPLTVTIPVTVEAPQAVIAGSPFTGAINTPVALSSNGSTSPSGDPLSYLWTIYSSPLGSAAAFYSDTGATLQNATVAAPYFKGNLAGAYVVGLQVTDQITHATSTTTGTVNLLSPGSITWISGSSQSATVNAVYTNPFVFQVLATDGVTPLAGQAVDYSIWNGSATTLTAVTNSSGQVSFSVKAGRVSRIPGALNVWLAANPTLTANGTFVLTAAPAAYVALLSPGVLATADAPVPVTVQVVDQFGNLSTTNAVADQTEVSLTVTSPSGGAKLQAGSTAATTLVAQLASGQVIVNLNDTVAESATITMQPASAGTQVLPYAAWETDVYDSGQSQYPQNAGWFAEQAVGSGVFDWSVVTNLAQVNTNKVTAYGVSAVPSLLTSSGTTSYVLTSPVTELPPGITGTSSIVLAGFEYSASVGSAYDATRDCNAQPALYATSVQPSGAEFLGESDGKPVNVLGGYPTLSTCSGHASFSSSTTGTSGDVTNENTVTNAAGWGAAELDVTDAVSSGYDYLALGFANSADTNEPSQTAQYDVDDVWTSSFIYFPFGTSAVAPVNILPGAAKKIAVSSSSPPAFGTCTTTPPSTSFTISLEEEDAWSNEVPGAPTGTLSWTVPSGSPPAAVSPVGIPLSNPVSSTPVAFSVGTVSVAFQSENLPYGSSPEPATFSVTINAPSTVPSPAVYNLTPVCHSSGTGAEWQDEAALGTYNVTEATYACESQSGGANTCATESTGQYVYSTNVMGSYPYYCSVSDFCSFTETYIWYYGRTANAFSDVCGNNVDLAPGAVTSPLWMGACLCNTGSCENGTIGTLADFYNTGSSTTWN